MCARAICSFLVKFSLFSLYFISVWEQTSATTQWSETKQFDPRSPISDPWQNNWFVFFVVVVAFVHNLPLSLQYKLHFFFNSIFAPLQFCWKCKFVIAKCNLFSGTITNCIKLVLFAVCCFCWVKIFDYIILLNIGKPFQNLANGLHSVWNDINMKLSS